MRTDEKAQTAKLLLMSGKKLSVAELNRRLRVNNSPEIIRRLRKEVDVLTTMERNPKTKTWFGVYSIPKPPKKENRIVNQTYSRV